MLNIYFLLELLESYLSLLGTNFVIISLVFVGVSIVLCRSSQKLI